MSESVFSKSDECNPALDTAQQYDDASWKEIENSFACPTNEEQADTSNFNLSTRTVEGSEKSYGSDPV